MMRTYKRLLAKTWLTKSLESSLSKGLMRLKPPKSRLDWAWAEFGDPDTNLCGKSQCRMVKEDVNKDYC